MAIAECTTETTDLILGAELPKPPPEPLPLESRQLTVQRGPGTGWTPSLRLQGQWLAQAGFGIGANVRVLLAPGRLVVELSERDPDSVEPRIRRRRTAS
jgi:hypothetical protein